MPIKYYDGNLRYEGSDMSLVVPQIGKAKGSRNKFSKKVCFDGIEYNTVREFSEKFKINKNSVSRWVTGKTPMPSYFYDRNLHYKGQDTSVIRRSDRK